MGQQGLGSKGMEPILVTGASGNVGRELVQLLQQQGRRVRATVLPAEEPRQDADSGVEHVPFDFGDHATYAEALREVRRVFLLRPPAITDIPTYIDPFIAAAKEAGVAQIVFLSLLGAEKIPFVPHRKIEASLLASGMAYTFLRPSFFMQNLSTTHRDEIRRGRIVVPAGRGRTSFIDAKDVAAVAARALTEAGHENKAYALTGSEALDYGQVAALFTEILGRPVAYTQPGLLQFVRWSRARRTEWPYLLVMAAIYTTARLGLAAVITEDLEPLIGRPATTMREFIAAHERSWM